MHRQASHYSGSKRNWHWLLLLFWRLGACTWISCVFKVCGDILRRYGASFPVSSTRLLCCRPKQLLGSILMVSFNVFALKQGHTTGETPLLLSTSKLNLSCSRLSECKKILSCAAITVYNWVMGASIRRVMTCSRFYAWLHEFLQIGNCELITIFLPKVGQ
jgi:hypothetical protein